MGLFKAVLTIPLQHIFSVITADSIIINRAVALHCIPQKQPINQAIGHAAVTMSAVSNAALLLKTQLQQKYNEVTTNHQTHQTNMTKINEQLDQLYLEKQQIEQTFQKRQEEEEEEQWRTFQLQYDVALKDKQACEVVYVKYKQVMDQMHLEKENIMELKTNKETEEQMVQWQQAYNDAMTKKDEAEYTLQKGMERLRELREIQSAYLNKREEEDAAIWNDFQEKYDAALEERKVCEELLKGSEEEMVRLQGEMQQVATELKLEEEEENVRLNSLPSMDVSSLQSHQDDEEQQQQIDEGGEEDDVTLVNDVSAIVSNSDTAEETSTVNNTDSIEDNLIGEVSADTASQQNIKNYDDDDDQLNDTTRPQGVEASIMQHPPNHMMPYCGTNDDDMSLGMTTISSSVSRAAEFKKDLSALDKFLPPAEDEMSFVSGRSSRSTRSTSSRSVRRRDVIKPIALDEMSNNSTLPTVEQEDVFVAKIDGTVEEKSLTLPSWALSTQDDDVNGNDKILEQSNPQCDQQFALVVHDPTQKAPRPTNLEPEEGRAALHLGNDPPGETPNERPFIDPNDDAINDSSSSSCSYIRGGGRSRNVKWVDPKNVHDEDIDFGLLNVYEQMTGQAAANGQSSTNSFKAQQQRISDPPEDLPKNNYYPEDDDSSSNARMTKASILRDNRRIRIATISSGYKTANYFVREDLDTRIYFHELEDAINYMTRRGYARMKKEDEEEWIKLIGRAHGVVKIGPTKKKQRYRKGKLVMILSKEINDNDDGDEYKKSQNCDSSEATDRTSLGRSVRCGFKSYSEKFLAEQEADKQSTLLQLTNGDGVDGAGHLLQLTNGEALSSVGEATLESSKDSMGSDRKGVYGGGVRYFTSDDCDDESDYHSDGSEDDEESEENSDEEFDEDESDTYEEEQEEMHEVEGSMGSMFSDEDSFRDNRSTGVDSFSASSTLSSGYPTPVQYNGKYREREPSRGLVAIDDESGSASAAS